MLFVNTIVCNQCGKAIKTRIFIRIKLSENTCKKCFHKEERFLSKEFCSEDCAARFLKRYKNHKCKEHIEYQVSEKHLVDSIKKFGPLNRIAYCSLCNKLFMGEAKLDKKGNLKIILREPGKS